MPRPSLCRTLHACLRVGLLVVLTGMLVACERAWREPWNSPYPAAEARSNILYTTFQERPKHLDPVSSYSENEAMITSQVYEPLVQYHFLRRPYTLVPLTAAAVPVATYYDADGRELPPDAADDRIARAVYRIAIRPGIRFQPHPAFARRADGGYRYHGEGAARVPEARAPADFPAQDTRELKAADYVYQIKRLAHPRLHSPIASLMGKYIIGLDALAARLKAEAPATGFLDLRPYALEGVRVIDDYTFEIALGERYPQFVYWLAMPFFAPVPWEAERFYAEPGMAERNLTLDWYPVGTGPYLLRENNPNRRMVLARNPNFHGERYPARGEPADAADGLLADAGRALPFIDEVHFMLEKEDIPEWGKFLQGWYDISPIAPDGFDQAIRFDPGGRPELTPEMRAKRMKLAVATQPTIVYLGFNMLDPVVGGYGRRARALRQALSIAIDIEEMISIFANGRGIPAQGPIPPGIFGHREGAAGINPIVYDWQDGRAVRKPLAHAQALMVEAGYPDGRNPATGKPLTLYFDAFAFGPDYKPLFNWYRKQFAKLGVQLVVRMTDYNRFQDKVRTGAAQIYSWGWNADYPDPENFLFLLYGPHGKVEHHGENASNYASADFDRDYLRMRSLPNGPARRAVIDRMLARVRRDAPWIWGTHPQAYSLFHAWYANGKANMMARNTLKYRRLDPERRAVLRRAWNRPVLTPLFVLGAIIVLVALLAWRTQRARSRRAAA
ncbi:MAG TPA: ABC transporter substrate-binding protein [Gammaproteobacteria bacterium]|nr:ABC transporter substrate-binding protein [Gammaproteobacteria bacterium]